MKKLSYYLSVALLSATVVMTSCKKSEDDPTPDNLTPDVSLSMNETNGTGTANKDLTVMNDQGSVVLEVTAVTTSSKDMKRLYVYKQEDNGTINNVSMDGFKQDNNNNYYYEIPNDSENNFTLKRSVSVSSNTTRDTDVYYFYFTDASNFNRVAPGADLVLGPGTITLIYDVKLTTGKTAQKLYNICSSSFPSAYNLQTLTGVSATVDPITSAVTVSSGADLVQQSGFANCGTFDGWDGQSGTTYVKAGSGFDYANATRNAAEETYTDGTATANVTGVAVGDIYIANVRGEGKYAVMRVTSINATPSNDNGDYYQFDVKK